MDHRQTIERMGAQGVPARDILQHLVEDCGVAQELAAREVEAVLGPTGLPLPEQPDAPARETSEQPLSWAGWIVLLAALSLSLVTGIPQAAIAIGGEPVSAELREAPTASGSWLDLLDAGQPERRQYHFTLQEREFTGEVSAALEPGVDATTLTIYYLPGHPAWHSPDDGFPWWRSALLLLLGWITWREIALRRRRS